MYSSLVISWLASAKSTLSPEGTSFNDLKSGSGALTETTMSGRIKNIFPSTALSKEATKKPACSSRFSIFTLATSRSFCMTQQTSCFFPGSRYAANGRSFSSPSKMAVIICSIVQVYAGAQNNRKNLTKKEK